MIEFILEGFLYLFVEILFKGTLIIVHWIGIAFIKTLTFSKGSMEELKLKYKNSPIPYFIGFGLLITLVYLLVRTFS